MDSGFSGHLSVVPLVDLLRKLSSLDATGVLKFRTPVAPANVWWVDGTPVDAVMGRRTGLSVLDTLALFDDANFTFTPGEVGRQAVIELSAEHLVSHCTQQVSEGAQLLAALPPLADPITLDEQLLASNTASVDAVQARALRYLRKGCSILELLVETEHEPRRVLRSLTDWANAGVLGTALATPRSSRPAAASEPPGPISIPRQARVPRQPRPIDVAAPRPALMSTPNNGTPQVGDKTPLRSRPRVPLPHMLQGDSEPPSTLPGGAPPPAETKRTAGTRVSVPPAQPAQPGAQRAKTAAPGEKGAHPSVRPSAQTPLAVQRVAPTGSESFAAVPAVASSTPWAGFPSVHPAPPAPRAPQLAPPPPTAATQPGVAPPTPPHFGMGPGQTLLGFPVEEPDERRHRTTAPSAAASQPPAAAAQAVPKAPIVPKRIVSTAPPPAAAHASSAVPTIPQVPAPVLSAAAQSAAAPQSPAAHQSAAAATDASHLAKASTVPSSGEYRKVTPSEPAPIAPQTSVTPPPVVITSASTPTGAAKTDATGNLEGLDEVARLSDGERFIVHHVRTAHRGPGAPRYALKMPRRRSAELNAELEREAATLSGLHHPNIVDFERTGLEVETRFLLTKFAPGLTVGQLLARGSVTPPRALAIAQQLLEVLVYLHDPARADGALVHANLCPENVLVCNDGVVRLCGFSSARPMNSGAWEQDVRCEARFASPELLSGENVDGRTDVYSVGTLLQALHTESKSEPLRNILARASQTDRELRYPSAAQALMDLSRISEPVAGKEELACWVVDEQPSPPVQPLSTPPAQLQPKRPRRALWLTLGILVGIAGAVGAVLKPWQWL